MKKICIINHGLASGGTDAFVISILKNIDRKKFTVDLFLAVNPDSQSQFREDEARKFLNELSGNLYKIGDLGSMSQKINYVTSLYKAFKVNGPYDVVHSNMDLFNGINLMVARFAGIKKRISHSHSSGSQYEKETKRHLAVKIYRSIMRNFIQLFSTNMLGCSNLALKYLYGKKYVNNKKCLIVYNGIDFTKFKPIEITQTNNIAVVGAISSVKNPFFTVEVIKELRKIRSDFKVFWVGNGALKSEVESKISYYKLNDNIIMLGARNDVDTILKDCSIFLMPSLFEGLGIALVEAQASDLICVVSDRIPKEADCGKCEFLPLEIGADQWASVIDEYLSGRKNKYLKEDLIKRFDDNEIIKQIQDVYMSY